MKSHENNTLQTNNVVRKAYPALCRKHVSTKPGTTTNRFYHLCHTAKFTAQCNARLYSPRCHLLCRALQQKTQAVQQIIYFYRKLTVGSLLTYATFLLLSSFFAFAQFTLTFYLCLIAEVRFCVCLTLTEVHKSHPLTT